MKQLLVAVLAALLVAAVQGGLLGRIFHRGSNETTTTTTTTTEAPRRPFFINNNVPAIPTGCEAQFKCKKKLADVPAPRPCVKYCLQRISCPNGQNTFGTATQCVDLDEQQVKAAHEASTASPGAATTEKPMMVAMIDFPCQPGYLPDHRGRCREIW
ncbi:uncharacterized protein LOC6554894 [Drosophila erecta]|uniref:GG11173 n=1 Tax=Drosophila erecta TaxID=7220 RepID=B3P8I0_DROER|nr:uncharacterized protein LOC6554894 [Drosophila erecta]EDV54075.1 uncharacterized protein Dere_GG11173 [Drosophila erecta]